MRRRGFTLLELLVVIVIILILLGIGVAVGPAVMGGGEQAVTKMALLNAQQILDEYLTLTNKTLTTSDTTQTVMGAAYGIASLKARMAAIPQDVVGSGYSLKDGWGTAIVLNPTGQYYAYMPKSSGPYFASAGPDAQWGDVTKAVSTTAYQQSQDNLYSFSVK